MRLNNAMFVGRYSVEIHGPWSDFALISLNDPGAKDGDATISDGWHDLLRLSFHDITPETLDLEGSYTLMTDKHAQAIIDFVREVAPNVNGILVHCRASISRSAGVVKWISDEYQLPFNANYEKYNAFVYRLLEQAAKGSNVIEDGEAHLIKSREIVNTKGEK
jgi:hypothetical protein